MNSGNFRISDDQDKAIDDFKTALFDVLSSQFASEIIPNNTVSLRTILKNCDNKGFSMIDTLIPSNVNPKYQDKLHISNMDNTTQGITISQPRIKIVSKTSIQIVVLFQNKNLEESFKTVMIPYFKENSFDPEISTKVSSSRFTIFLQEYNEERTFEDTPIETIFSLSEKSPHTIWFLRNAEFSKRLMTKEFILNGKKGCRQISCHQTGYTVKNGVLQWSPDWKEQISQITNEINEKLK